MFQYPTNEKPLYVAYGLGVDSTAALVGLQARGVRPDAIVWADTGDEKSATYAYLPIINAWLERVGFPQVTVVKNASPKAGYKSLSESLLKLGTLPSPAYGTRHTCTLVWKIDPQIKFLKNWQLAIDAAAKGQLVTVVIGYDNGAADGKRCAKAMNNNLPMPGCENSYPLRSWGWDRAECERQIAAAGLPVPVKSACFHCPSSKNWEIEFLAKNEPELARRAIQIEINARASGKAKKLAGLGRKFAWTPILEAHLG